MHIESTPIEGLLVVHLDVHGDARGWFKENWQREKMVAAGLPDFKPVQNNVSHANKGSTRGLHAEPWDKLISIGGGRAFCAWCDVRAESATYGKTFTLEVDPNTAVFVPWGVANGYQALEDNTTYSYLVNAHWSPDARYTMVNLSLIDWPLEPSEISDKDKAHPALEHTIPMPPRRILITGASGQLGQALHNLTSQRPDASRFEFCTHADFDITCPPKRDWSTYCAIINCAAYNDVNGAETFRSACWETNALAPARLAAIAAEHNLTLVHVSSDYTLDGSHKLHADDETPAPLSLYGAAKAAGEASASVAPKHYVVRTSWVFGEGKNFVQTMADLARRGIKPKVIADQRGRPTWAGDLAAGIMHLLLSGAPFGAYNLSSTGPVATRAEIARAVFAAVGADPDDVTPVTTQEYGDEPAVRPKESAFDLGKLEATGFVPGDWRRALKEYVRKECARN